MQVQLLISVILITQALGLKNPCRKKNYQEFLPHPESVNHYIQCSRRGDMIVKECRGAMIWSAKLKKCDQADSQSQIKTLASRYKIKKLLLERPLNESNTAPSRKTQLEIRQNTGSLANKQFGQSTQIQSLEQQLLDAQVKAQEFKHKQTQILIEKNQQQQLDKQNAIIKQNKLNNISNQLKQEAAQSSQNLEQTIQSKFPDLSRENQDLFDVSVENPVLSLTTTTTIATTVITSTTVSDAIINNQKSLDQLNIETMNLFNEEIGQQKIEATRKAMMEDETEKLKDMITKQAEINKPAVHRSASQKFFEEMQLAKQKRVQELLINQGQSRIQNIVEQQQVREKDLLNQQVEMRELFNQKNKKVIDEIIEKQKEREKTEIAEQKRKQADMVSMNIRRQEKERNMCSKVSCPSGFKCALDKGEETLICLPF